MEKLVYGIWYIKDYEMFCKYIAFDNHWKGCIDKGRGFFSYAFQWRIARVLKELEGRNRRARFVCVISIAFNNEVVGSFRGEVYGKIIDESCDTNGFGYDPVFMPDGFNKTFAELTRKEKNKISHRANAIEKVIEFVEDEMFILDDELS